MTPATDPAARARAAMTVVARTALVAVLAGAALVLTDRGRKPVGEGPTDRWATTGRTWLGLALFCLGLLGAVAVVWHGVRGAHERGRRVAVATIVLGLAAAVPLLMRALYVVRGG